MSLPWSGLSPADIIKRRNWIGGSDAGAIVAGGEEWPKLWAVKTGRAAPEDLSGVLRVAMGLATEGLNKYWYEKQTGRQVTRCQEVQRHPRLPYLRCTLDGVTWTSRGFPTVWQAKHIGRFDEASELRYRAQGHHEAACAEVDWYVLSVFVGNGRWELVEVECDRLFSAEYIDRCKLFWSHVVTDREPPADVQPLGVPPLPKLRTVSLADTDRKNWPNWGAQMVSEILNFAHTKPAFDYHAATRERIKALLPDDVGRVERGLFHLLRTRSDAIRMTLDKGDDDE